MNAPGTRTDQRHTGPTSFAPATGPTPRLIIAMVALVALAANGLCIAGSQLWVYPDSIDYIRLAGGLADRLDLTQELFLIRTPGYPFLLAGIFAIFGSASPTAILLLQHAMAVGTAVLAAATAWRLTGRRLPTIITGAMTACSLQILSYANLVLTETPYALILVACVYFLVRFVREHHLRLLASASLMAGLSYLFRPVGLHLLGACLFAAALGGTRRRTNSGTNQGTRKDRLRAGPTGCAIARYLCAAIAPAIVIIAPWSMTNSMINGGVEAARCLDYVFYIRPATFDGLDSKTSEAMADIHRVVDEAKQRGAIAADASYRDRGTVIKAYHAVRGSTFAQASAILGRAGRDLMLEHPWEIAVGTLRYSMWMLQSPDPVYRFQPAGAPGVNGKRDGSAEIFDITTYSRGPGSWEPVLREHKQYLPLKTAPPTAAAFWTDLNRRFYEQVDAAAPVGGVLDSRYEQFIVLCALGAVLSLLRRGQEAWLVIALVITGQVVVSALLGGPQTRYAMPIKPLILLYFALLATAAADLLRRFPGWCLSPAASRRSSTEWATGETARTAPAGS